MSYHRRTTCRICGSSKLHCFLSLGPSPLANSFLNSPDEFAVEAVFPLDIFFCENCSLVQLIDVVDPEVIFRDYIYITGISSTIISHYKEYAATVVDLLGMQSEDLVIEIGSNDGSLLQAFREHGVGTLGVEPATNIAHIAQGRGIETTNEFFNSRTAAVIREAYGPAKAVVANNVMAHVDDTLDFLKGARSLLDIDGLITVEVPYLMEMLNNFEYDTIYHEHLCYFSVGTLVRLCEKVGLSFVRVDRIPLHGGSLRMYAGRQEFYPNHGQKIMEMVAEEQALGLHTLNRYQRFANDVNNHRQQMYYFLEQLNSAGKRVVGYGAPAKPLAFYCDIGPDLIPYTVDKNPLKVGTFTPGNHIPVRQADTLLAEQPDYVLILAWNFANEIMNQQQAYRDRGGAFILPIPNPRIVGN